MHLNLDGDWKDYSPTKVQGGEATYDIPLGDAAPKKIRAAFFDGKGQNKKWVNNGGRNFGKNIQVVLDSSNVQVALGVEAKRRGASRGALKSGSLRSVTQALFNNERSRLASRGKKKSTTKTQKQRTPRHQRALQRAIKASGTAAMHTHKLKGPRVRKAGVKKTTKIHQKHKVKARPYTKFNKADARYQHNQRGSKYQARKGTK